MSRLFYTMGILVTIFIVVAVGLSVKSRQKPFPGIDGGKLAVCPDTPNCVCSEYPEDSGYIKPLWFTDSADAAWVRVREAVRATGGRIVQEGDGYLAATYTSLVFRFVDELELRLEKESKRIHIRSASRVGYSDLGVNRKRVMRLRSSFRTRTPP